MRGAIMHGPRDVRLEDRDDPKIIEPTDAIIRLSATCICGSDLWPYRGIEPIQGPTPTQSDRRAGHPRMPRRDGSSGRPSVIPARKP